MDNVFPKNHLKVRRGVSNIIGSLIVLAIVASVGSVILFQGLNQINLFSHDLSLHDRENNMKLRESITIEHVRFDPNSSQIELYLANTGTVDYTVDTVTIVKIDTQELVMAWKDVPASDATILVEDHKQINLDADLNGSIWNSTYYQYSPYKITISTTKGTFEPTVRTPGDTFNS